MARTEVADDSAYAGRTLGDVNLETETGVRVIAIRRRGGGRGDWITNPDHETTLDAGDVLLIRGPGESLGAVYETASGEPYERPPPPEPDIEDLGRAMDSLVLMKDMSELAVDLAYGSVLFDSTDIAEEVVQLEAEVDALKSRFEAWTLKAAARVGDPLTLRGLVHIATSTEVISDAALEISEGVLRGLDTHVVVAEAVEESDEVIVRIPVAAGSALDGATLGEREVKTETGMRVIAVRRPGETDEWVVQPGPDTAVSAGDVLLAKGTRASTDRLQSLAT